MEAVMGWKKMEDTAWRTAGRRFWKPILAVKVTGKVLPHVAGVVVFLAVILAVRWVVTHAHVPDVSAPQVSLPAGWGWWAGGGLAALLVVLAVRRARNPYRLPTRRPVLRAVMVLAVLGVLAGAALWGRGLA